MNSPFVRRALIIAAPDAVPQHPIPGTLRDAQRQLEYLTSPTGGAWLPTEIKAIKVRSSDELDRAIEWVSDADLAFTFVGAHGGTLRGHSVVMLAPDLVVGVSRFVLTRPTWSLTCIDACRTRVLPLEETRVASIGGIQEEGDPRSLREHRKYFEMAVSRTNPCRELLQSCMPGQQAAEDPRRGGVFSQEFIAAAESTNADAPVVRTAREVMEEIKPLVHYATDGQQLPARQAFGGASVPVAVHVPPAIRRMFR